jgi:hypothetical protein
MQKEVRALTRIQGKWKQSPVSNEEFITLSGNRLKHVNPSFVSELYTRYCDWVSQHDNDKQIVTYPELLGMESYKPGNINFYVQRGWSLEQAKHMLYEHQNNNTIAGIMKRHGVSANQARDIQLARTNRGEDTKLSRSGGKDSLTHRRQEIMRSIVTNNLTKLSEINNISIDEARTLHSAQAREIKEMLITTGQLEIINNTSIQWFINQGMSPDDAKRAQSERQRTFSLKKCIAKHGVEAGTDIWKLRQQKWLATMNSKSDDEKLRILVARVSASKFVSPASRKFFDELASYVDTRFTIYTGDNEYYINDAGKFWKYDFTIVELNLIVEYNGEHVHPRDDSPDEWRHAYTKQTKQEVLQHDVNKRMSAISRGFDVLYVWHGKNKHEQLEQLITIVKQRTDNFYAKNQ